MLLSTMVFHLVARSVSDPSAAPGIRHIVRINMHVLGNGIARIEAVQLWRWQVSSTYLAIVPGDFSELFRITRRSARADLNTHHQARCYSR
jgi:hypothetical protein